MSEEKLYAVKNDHGQVWSFEEDGGFWWPLQKLTAASPFTTVHKEAADEAVNRVGGHIVTFIEEPEKVVLTKKQAQVVKEAHHAIWPAKYITDHTDVYSGEESLLMNAYVNGYTVAKDKRYLVGLDGLVTTDGAKQYLTKKDGKWFACRRMPGMHQDFTDDELKTAPKWAQQLYRVEVTDNGK